MQYSQNLKNDKKIDKNMCYLKCSQENGNRNNKVIRFFEN